MYYLKHKDDVVAKVELERNAMQIIVKEVISADLLPLCAQSNPTNLNNWWKRRAIPTSRTNIRQLLSDNKLSSPHELLLKNLALSVIDSYWVCPESINIDWKDVSFHGNDFQQDLHFSSVTDTSCFSVSSSFSPSASLGGDLDKRWIRRREQIYLVKGNMPGNSYQQSLNEVFASSIHKAQKFGNFVDYKLIKLANGTTGCISSCFANEDLEFIPAWEVFDKYGNNKKDSMLTQYIKNCEKEGISSMVHRAFLDYQFLIDFVLSNTDRHLANFGILRDANTLKCVTPAPIFDSGNSMFYDGIVAVDYHTLVNLKINSMYSTERKIIENITDLKSVNLDKLPSMQDVVAFYEKDPSLISFVSKIAECFEFKKAMLYELQMGKAFADISKDINNFYSGRVRKEKERLLAYPQSILA